MAYEEWNREIPLEEQLREVSAILAAGLLRSIGTRRRPRRPPKEAAAVRPNTDAKPAVVRGPLRTLLKKRSRQSGRELFWQEKVCSIGSIPALHLNRAGALLQGLGLAKDVKTVRISGGAHEKEPLPTFKLKLRRAFAGAWSDFRGVLLFVVIGVAIGAVVYGYVPGDFVVRVAGPQNPLAVPVAAAIGVPLYVRAETVIPIGVALTQKGMSIGAVIALIIGGAGMSIPEMSMLAAIFKVRLVAVFVGVVFTTAVLAGFIFNVI